MTESYWIRIGALGYAGVNLSTALFTACQPGNSIEIMSDRTYCGIEDDYYGGMTPLGTIIRDAWVFGILPETETCKDWDHTRLQAIHDRTKLEWDKYGCLVSNLPEELRQRHADIYGRAVENARALGWDPELAEDD